jgi:hypothetical protein
MTTDELAMALLTLPRLPPAERDRECTRLAGEAKGALARCRADAAREAHAAGTSYAEHARQAGVKPPIISRLLADFPQA